MWTESSLTFDLVETLANPWDSGLDTTGLFTHQGSSSHCMFRFEGSVNHPHDERSVDHILFFLSPKSPECLHNIFIFLKKSFEGLIFVTFEMKFEFINIYEDKLT